MQNMGIRFRLGFTEAWQEGGRGAIRASAGEREGFPPLDRISAGAFARWSSVTGDRLPPEE